MFRVKFDFKKRVETSGTHHADTKTTPNRRGDWVHEEARLTREDMCRTFKEKAWSYEQDPELSRSA